MSSPANLPSARSPWILVWLRPRSAIAGVLANDPKRYVLALAVLGAAADVAFQLGEARSPAAFLDWRIIALAVPIVVALGVAGLYLRAIVLKWIGRPLGGQA